MVIGFRRRSQYVLMHAMRFEREHLILKALAALDEAVAQSRDEPVRRTMALRFALAFLYAAGNGERRVFDEFWQCIGDPMTSAFSDAIASTVRGTNAQTCLNGIARSVGIELTAEVDELLADACAPKAERDRRRAARDAIEQAKAAIIERSRENARLHPLPGLAEL